MYLIDVLKDSTLQKKHKQKIIVEAINHFQIIPAKFWIELNSYCKSLLTQPFYLSHRSNTTTIMTELFCSRLKIRRHVRTAERKYKIYDKNIANFLKINGYFLAKKAKEEIKYRYLIEEVLFSRNEENIISICQHIPDLNQFFKGYSINPSYVCTTPKLFRFLTQKGYKFINPKLSTLMLIIQNKDEITFQDVNVFFRDFDMKEIKQTPQETIDLCFNKTISAIKDTPTKELIHLKLHSLDNLILTNAPEHFVSDLIDCRKRIAEAHGLPTDCYFPYLIPKEILPFVKSNFNYETIFSEEIAIQNLKQTPCTKEENGYKVFLYPKNIEVGIEAKKHLPKAPEDKLIQIPARTLYSFLDSRYFENTLPINTLNLLKHHYSDLDIVDFLISIDEVANLDKLNALPELSYNIHPKESDIYLPKKIPNIHDLEVILRFYSTSQTEPRTLPVDYSRFDGIQVNDYSIRLSNHEDIKFFIDNNICFFKEIIKRGDRGFLDLLFVFKEQKCIGYIQIIADLNLFFYPIDGNHDKIPFTVEDFYRNAKR